uniref:Flagellar hook-associated protein 2 n=1 Tax=uncultured bacterium contig00030 TaxID=1181519 RepID=A0A806KIT1_9BACT|nr:flagellar hook-associated protein FliD [uncultured bacterium contig00030]
MSDVYIPGVRSRFNSEQTIQNLMQLERIPKERTESNIENLQTQKGYWQEIGRRVSAVRDSARFLYSFQNPFNDRLAVSADEYVITGSATREAAEQSYRFSVKQTAQADRFISSPLDEKMKIDAGNYTFTVGNETVSINYRGGSLREFVDTVNRRGRDIVGASLIAIQSGTRSLLIESKVTGEDNRLGLHDAAEDLAINTGMMEKGNDTRREIAVAENNVKKNSGGENIVINNGVLQVGARSSASLPVGISLSADSPVILRMETSTRVEASGIIDIPPPPPGPTIPAGSVTYGGITIENEPSLTPMPEWSAPQAPVRVDDMAVLSLVFSDGSSAKLPAITDSTSPTTRQWQLSETAQGRTIASLNIENNNTHRDVSVGNIEIFDPTVTTGGLKPLNAVSTARDAIIMMEGIEVKRPSNNIDDLIPGLTLNVRGVSEKPVELNIRSDTERVKEAIVNFVGNYNRLLAEINILTRASPHGRYSTDERLNPNRLIDELTYWWSYPTKEEADEMRSRLGAFSGDTTLNSLRNNLQRTVSAPYPTSLERDLAMLAQIGISTNPGGRTGGYDSSGMRGYLDIDEKVLDAALETKIPAIKELFASDTSGDMLMDTGVAYNIDQLVRPFVEVGGIITLKQNTLDSRIRQDERRIDTMERQLAAKEQELKIQYARMESAYARMEQMSNSLDNFSQQTRGNR